MHISLLGCGWLGLPLAKSLIKKGVVVKGSVTSHEKLPVLSAEGIEPFIISLFADRAKGDISSFLKGSDVLIIDIPPRLRNTESESFTAKIKTLIPYIEVSGIQRVLFISSISVYGKKNTDIVTEETIPHPDTESGKQLLESEQALITNPAFKTTILRFAGLTGGERHPVYHLAGKENLPNPHAPVNLIRRDDCIAIILSIIEKEAWGEIFNAAAPQHPSKEQYYTQKAIELGLEPPKFTGDGCEGKIISSEKLIKFLKYVFNS